MISACRDVKILFTRHSVQLIRSDFFIYMFVKLFNIAVGQKSF